MAFNLPNTQLRVDFVASTYSTEIGFPITISASNNRDGVFLSTNEGLNSNHILPLPGRTFLGLTFSTSFAYPDQTQIITLYQSSGRLTGYATQSFTVREVSTIMASRQTLITKITQSNLNRVYSYSIQGSPTVACDYDIATPSNSFFYTTANTNSLSKITIYGSQSWSYNHGAEVRSCAIDKSGFVYLTGGVSSNLTTRKLTSTASVAWSVNHAAIVNCIAVDTSSNVYTGGQRSSNLTTRKYDSAGVLQWSVDHGALVNGITVNSSGDVYTGGGRNANIGATNNTTRKYNSTGTLQWSKDHGAAVRCICIDSSGNIYTGGDRTSNLTTRKYDSSGTLLWSIDHGSGVYGIAIDTSNRLYTASETTIRVYDLNGNFTTEFATNGVGTFWQTLDTLPSTRNQL